MAHSTFTCAGNTSLSESPLGPHPLPDHQELLWVPLPLGAAAPGSVAIPAKQETPNTTEWEVGTSICQQWRSGRTGQDGSSSLRGETRVWAQGGPSLLQLAWEPKAYSGTYGGLSTHLQPPPSILCSSMAFPWHSIPG